MLDLFLPRIKYCVAIVLLGICAQVLAKPLSEEFLNYMMEYSDDEGEVLDPIEFDEIRYVQEDHKIDSSKLKTADMAPEDNLSSSNKGFEKVASSVSRSSKAVVEGAK